MLSDTVTVTPELLNVRQVAEILGCSARHVYRLSDAGKMPAPVRLGTLIRWRRAEVLSWLEDGCPVVRHVKGRGQR
ncbi:MAG: helix-turn-helix domain-containing protein [Planctomycetaceae bacterium]|nr:helix-turn-helix domain-containing protein [Planctomycetaceae bacterium]